MFIDTHAHLLDEKFDDDRTRLIKELREEQISWVLECADDMDTAVRAAALAREFREIYAAVGVHPHSAKKWEPGVSAKELQVLAREKRVVAIGEIGLDYHYDFSPRDVQKKVLREQMQLAQELQLPVVIHSREATADTLEILREYPRVRGVLHSFSGSVETMEFVLKMGYYVAIGGLVTFKNAKRVKEVAAIVPSARLLIETDSPYMTPEPYRGRRNEPKYVKLVAQKLAELRQEDVAAVAEKTTNNAHELFGISKE